MRAKLGFSLLELLVALVIISIILSFSFVGFNQFSKERQAKIIAEELGHYIKAIQQQAILQNKAFCLSFNSKGLTTFFYHHQWQQNKESLFRFRPFSSKILVQAVPTQIQISPSGEISPFSVALHTSNKRKPILLTSKDYENISITKE